jgi:hypothetical protein
MAEWGAAGGECGGQLRGRLRAVPRDARRRPGKHDRVWKLCFPANVRNLAMESTYEYGSRVERVVYRTGSPTFHIPA